MSVLFVEQVSGDSIYLASLTEIVISILDIVHISIPQDLLFKRRETIFEDG
jgi:hypothetical protein